MAAKRGVKMPRALPHSIGAMGRPKVTGKGSKAKRGAKAITGTTVAPAAHGGGSKK